MSDNLRLIKHKPNKVVADWATCVRDKAIGGEYKASVGLAIRLDGSVEFAIEGLNGNRFEIVGAIEKMKMEILATLDSEET